MLFGMDAVRGLVLAALTLPPIIAQELRHIDVPVWRHACFDPIRNRVIAPSIGGYSLEWDGAAWRQAADAGAPMGFCYVDDVTAQLCAVTRQFVGTGMQLNMWRRHGSHWQLQPSPNAPPVRNDMALCYDAARNELVAFGGFAPATSTPLGDTWTWNGSAWTQYLVTGPTARANATTAYDTARQRVVLFGGYTSQSSFLNDTWEWNGSAWSQVTTANNPPPRIRAQAAYDQGRQRVVMIGPASSAGFPVEHWEYDGATWIMPTAPLPATSHSPVVVHDTARAETLLLGGFEDGGAHGEVWAWNGAAWSQRPGLGFVPFQSFGSEVAGHPTAPDIQMFGPYLSAAIGTIDELWTFNGTTWSLTASGGPSPRQEPLFWRLQNASYVFGGLIGVGVANDQWRWDGNAWSQLALTVAPPARSRASCAVDVVRDRVVIFGGYTGSGWSNDTWIFDGVSWSQAPAGPSPSPRYWAAMGYDPSRDRIVLHGGLGGPSGTTALTDTWEWDGSLWQQVVTGPPPPHQGRMTFDPASQHMLYFAPNPVSRDYEVWAFDGIAWTQQSMQGTHGSDNALRASLPRAVTTATGVFVADQYSGMHELVAMPARAEHYGTSCGTDAPALSAASLPRIPDAGFALDVTRAPANAPVRIAGAASSMALPFFGCTLLVAPSVTTLFGMSSATGHAELPLAIPNAPALVGMSLFFQAATLAPANSNGFALSDGLRVVLGH